jgi:site-specific DNA recombinase
MKAILYTRVSSEEQADKGFSLKHQKDVLYKYCDNKNIAVDMHFQEDFSAKTFDRPEWKKLEQYVMINRKTIDMILVTRWDRFSRNTGEAYRVIKKFQAWGVEINSMEQPLDMSVPENKIILGVYLTVPEVENDKISIRTMEGTRKAQVEGCYTNMAPFGYVNHRDDQGRSTLMPDEKKAEGLRYCFEKIASGTTSLREARIMLRRRFGIKYSESAFNVMFRKKVYIGMIEVKTTAKEPAVVVKGLHPPIIDEKTFYDVQDILDGRKPKMKMRAAVDENLPLRGFLECPRCGRLVTGSASRGRKSRHYYYHCRNGCKYRYPATQVNTDIERIFRAITPPANIIALFEAVYLEERKNSNKDVTKQLANFGREKAKYKEMIASAEDKFIEGAFSVEVFENIRTRYEKQLHTLDRSIVEHQSRDVDYEKNLKNGLSLIRRLDYFYRLADIDQKQKLIGSTFPEKIIYDHGICRTTKMNTIIGLIYGLSSENKEKEPLKIEGLRCGTQGRSRTGTSEDIGV